MRVQAYRNLNVRDHVAYSVRDAKTGLVIGHYPYVLLENVELRVQEGGRQRVIREKRKAVHAYVVGEKEGRAPAGRWFDIRYNPYLFASFVRAGDLQPVHKAKYVLLDDRGAHAMASGTWAPNPGGVAPPGEVNLWNG